MKRIAILVFVCVGMVGCDTETAVRKDRSVVDQCLRREIFRECMECLPRGPERVANSNDWDEVISECAKQAYYNSLRPASQVKPECSSGGI